MVFIIAGAALVVVIIIIIILIIFVAIIWIVNITKLKKQKYHHYSSFNKYSDISRGNINSTYKLLFLEFGLTKASGATHTNIIKYLRLRSNPRITEQKAINQLDLHPNLIKKLPAIYDRYISLKELGGDNQAQMYDKLLKKPKNPLSTSIFRANSNKSI